MKLSTFYVGTGEFSSELSYELLAPVQSLTALAPWIQERLRKQGFASFEPTLYPFSWLSHNVDPSKGVAMLFLHEGDWEAIDPTPQEFCEMFRERLSIRPPD